MQHCTYLYNKYGTISSVLTFIHHTHRVHYKQPQTLWRRRLRLVDKLDNTNETQQHGKKNHTPQLKLTSRVQYQINDLNKAVTRAHVAAYMLYYDRALLRVVVAQDRTRPSECVYNLYI